MIDVLVALHPQAWRNRYGDEFRALLEDGPMTPATVLDVVAHAATVRAQAHLAGLLALAALAVSAVSHVVALRTGVADNVMWAPTDPTRALLLAGTVVPWMALGARWWWRRRTARAVR